MPNLSSSLFYNASMTNPSDLGKPSLDDDDHK